MTCSFYLEGVSYLKRAIDVPYCHHEKWDGRGYPQGLSGADIPLAARVFAVVDVYDALRSERCYKEAFDHEKSIGIIVEGAGSHFDPEIVSVFTGQPPETWAELDEASRREGTSFNGMRTIIDEMIARVPRSLVLVGGTA